MNVVTLPIGQLRPAAWNSNVLDDQGMARLKTSLDRYGLVQNLVVRPLDDDCYEVLSGNQRLRVLVDSNVAEAPCVVVDLNDAQAMLLAQALNRIHGEDDLGLRAELIRQVLAKIPEAEVLRLLPETGQSLQNLRELGAESLAEHLEAWQKAQAARLRHMTFQLSNSQLGIVEEALERIAAGATKGDENPNLRGNALFALCQKYLESAADYTPAYTPEGAPS